MKLHCMFHITVQGQGLPDAEKELDTGNCNQSNHVFHNRANKRVGQEPEKLKICILK